MVLRKISAIILGHTRTLEVAFNTLELLLSSGFGGPQDSPGTGSGAGVEGDARETSVGVLFRAQALDRTPLWSRTLFGMRGEDLACHRLRLGSPGSFSLLPCSGCFPSIPSEASRDWDRRTAAARMAPKDRNAGEARCGFLVLYIRLWLCRRRCDAASSRGRKAKRPPSGGAGFVFPATAAFAGTRIRQAPFGGLPPQTGTCALKKARRRKGVLGVFARHPNPMRTLGPRPCAPV